MTPCLNARFPHGSTHWRQVVLATAAATCWSLVVPAHAQGDETAEVRRLLRASQYSEALSKADQYLANKPQDAQMRFLKGVIQTEGGKTSDAIATFTKLTEDFPELPEPYNNLAVLYAAQSQFDKARAALEMAIRSNPSYATAHENLGDVYAKLASQAYSKALQLDSSNSAVPSKLSLIRSLFAGASRPTVVATAPVPAPAATPAPAPSAAPAPVAAPKPAEPAASQADAQRDVRAAVDTWAKAWSAKDMKGYLGAYAQNFVPAGDQSRTNSESDSKDRIVPRTRINVEVSDLEVTVNGDRATAKFRQTHASDNLNSSNRKTLEMVKSGNRWLIVREISGS